MDSKKDNDFPIVGDLNLLNMVFSRNNKKEIDREKIESNIRDILKIFLPSSVSLSPC